MNDIDDAADSAMAELEERTELALRHAIEAGTPEEDIRLLCYHSGIRYETLTTRTK